MTAHTEGPWHLCEIEITPRVAFVLAENGATVAAVYPGIVGGRAWDVDKLRANGRAIAAVPTLLAALVTAADCLHNHRCDDSKVELRALLETLDVVRDALAEAREEVQA